MLVTRVSWNDDLPSFKWTWKWSMSARLSTSFLKHTPSTGWKKLLVSWLWSLFSTFWSLAPVATFIIAAFHLENFGFGKSTKPFSLHTSHNSWRRREILQGEGDSIRCKRGFLRLQYPVDWVKWFGFVLKTSLGMKCFIVTLQNFEV